MRNGKRNPKDYPYWQDLINLITVYYRFSIIQIGTECEQRFNNTGFFIKNPPFKQLTQEIQAATVVICVDNFMQHMAHYYDVKCIVLWGQSDPQLFGYNENVNLVKDGKYFRPNQFDVWESTEYKEDAFLPAKEVFEHIKHLL